MEDILSIEVEDIDISIIVDPDGVDGMSDEKDDVSSAEVSGVDVSPTVEDFVSAEVEIIDVVIVVDGVVVLGMPDEVADVCPGEVSGVDVSRTVVDCVSAELEDVDIATVVDPVVVLGMSDEVDDVCSGEVSGVDFSPTVVDVVSYELDRVVISTVLGFVSVEAIDFCSGIVGSADPLSMVVSIAATVVASKIVDITVVGGFSEVTAVELIMASDCAVVIGPFGVPGVEVPSGSVVVVGGVGVGGTLVVL